MKKSPNLVLESPLFDYLARFFTHDYLPSFEGIWQLLSPRNLSKMPKSGKITKFGQRELTFWLTAFKNPLISIHQILKNFGKIFLVKKMSNLLKLSNLFVEKSIFGVLDKIFTTQYPLTFDRILRSFKEGKKVARDLYIRLTCLTFLLV